MRRRRVRRRIETLLGIERVGHANLPGVKDSPAYRAFRKLELYKAAVEAAALDRRINEREREILDRLQKRLAISAVDARSIERDVAAAA